MSDKRGCESYSRANLQILQMRSLREVTFKGVTKKKAEIMIGDGGRKVTGENKLTAMSKSLLMTENR